MEGSVPVVAVLAPGHLSRHHVQRLVNGCQVLVVTPLCGQENHAFDCIGAKAAGMRTVFVDRRGRPFGNDRYAPDAVVPDFAQLATVLRAAQR